MRGIHLPHGGNLDSGEVDVRSLVEVAEIIGTEVGDLDVLRIGDRRIYLSQRAQRERTPLNRAATVVADKLVPALKLGLYGDVLVTREDVGSHEEN
jgi:hypothetical protein